MADSLNDTGLNPGTGAARSLLLNADGDLAFVGGSMVMARGVTAVRQEIRTRFAFWLGESFMDVTAGIDFFNEVFTKPPDVLRAQSAFRRELVEVAGVASVDEVTATFFPAERRLSLFYRCTLTDGFVLSDILEV